MGVHFLHSCGPVRGNLDTNNIMLNMPNIDTLSTEASYEKYQTPVQQAVKRLDGDALDTTVPPYTVSPLCAAVACETVANANITIADFGEAYLATNKSRPRLNAPALLSPPEILIGEGVIGTPAVYGP